MWSVDGDPLGEGGGLFHNFEARTLHTVFFLYLELFLPNYLDPYV